MDGGGCGCGLKFVGGKRSMKKGKKTQKRRGGKKRTAKKTKKYSRRNKH